MEPQQLQHGQGTVEFLFAAPLILLLGFSSIEALHWFFARQAVSQALVQAARAASTQHAHPQVIDTAFAEALLPLHAAGTRQASEARLKSAIAKRETATGLPAWHIEILSPGAATFEDFASDNPDLPRAAHAVIDNDYLQEQHQARLSEGWHQGRGPISGQTTLQANTLVLHLTWLHEPLLPGVKQVMKQLAPSDSRYGSQAMARAGFLPIQRRAAMVMQSHPIAWAMPQHGRIRRNGEHHATSSSNSSPGLPAKFIASNACRGLWCLQPTEEETNAQPGLQPNLPLNPEQNPPSLDGDIVDSGPNENGPQPGPAYDPDDCPGCCN